MSDKFMVDRLIDLAKEVVHLENEIIRLQRREQDLLQENEILRNMYNSVKGVYTK